MVKDGYLAPSTIKETDSPRKGKRIGPSYISKKFRV